MDATSIFIIGILITGALAVLGIFTVAFKRGPSAGPVTIQELDVKARQADEASRAMKAEQRATDDEVTVAAVATVVEAPPEATADPLTDQIEVTVSEYNVTRRQFFNRALLAVFGLFLLQFALASLAFIWPKLRGGFGTPVNVGNLEEIKRETKGVGNRNNGSTAAEVMAVKKEWLDEWAPQFTSVETPLNQYRIIWDLMHLVDRSNTIITHDAGSPRDQLAPFWESVAPRTYQGWGKSTQLGYGLGLTMGAKLAEPDKLCVNIMGDAAIGMVGMDLETAVRNELGILTIVLNNGAMAIERDTMPIAIEKYGSVYQGGDYRAVAKALGGWGVRVERPEEIVPA
ncbi:MAG: hypothetical protein IH942_01965, partial [Acidobacteria bacterium]|nr:hypothetical protein [Acidobacteriota bacterium]